MSKVPKTVIARLSKQLPKYQEILKDANDRDVNESDTVTIVADILADVFGFDKYSEITSEHAIRGTYCDLAVVVDGVVKFLIEVKAIGLDLKENHLRQAVNYGANKGVQWVILTNGVSWEIYGLKFEKPIDWEQLCSFELTELSARKDDTKSLLFLLCKEGLAKAAMEEYQERISVVNRFVMAAILQSEPVLRVVRRELRRISRDIRVDIEELENMLAMEVLKRDVVHGDDAKSAESMVKRASHRSLKKVRSDREPV